MIVITGGLGHIGSRLMQSLADGFVDAEPVTVIDNLHSQRYCSLMNLERKGVRLIEADLCTFDERAARAIADASVVIHLAALTNATESKRNPKPYWDTNLPTLRRVAELCTEYDVPLIFPSTTSVYGTKDAVVTEESSLSPQSPYAETKVACEKYLYTLSNLKFVILRLGTICGVSLGMRFHTAVNKFCWQAMTGQPVSVWATVLHQKRPYLSLTDAVNAIKFVIDKSIFDREIYNVVTTNLTVDDILECIKEVVSDFRIAYTSNEIMNQLSYSVSMAKLMKVGFTTSADVRVDIHATLQLFEKLQR